MINTAAKILIVTTLVFFQGCEDPEPEIINKPPTARITVSIAEGDAPLMVNFNSSLSTDPELGILSYLWDFGDGSTSNSPNHFITYNEIGNFTVTLTVTDDGGLSDTDQVSIKVNQRPDLFPVTDKAQWVYLVKSTDTENGIVSGYEQGLTYLIAEEVNLEYETSEFITLRVTGKRYYNTMLLGNHIYIGHHMGKSLSVAHDGFNGGYQTMVDLDATSWSNYAMFFSPYSSLSVTQSAVNLTIGLGTFPAYKVRHQRDNWGENYVTERYDISEEEYLSPGLGLIYRKTTQYVAFLDCFTCPVYGGGDEIELVGYHITLKDGTILEEGYGYNPDNPYGGDLGLVTFWASVDIGYTELFLDGEFVGNITNYFPGGITCDESQAVNVFRPDGTYTLTASSSKGYEWEGDVTFFEGSCGTIELTLGKKGSFTGKSIGIIDPSLP